MEKLKIPYTVVVEGKYDKARILSVCDARVITTDGFGIFKKNEKLSLIRRLAQDLPVIIITDSDGAGKLIRSHICSALPQNKMIQLYIPQIKGKEKRKKEASAEGTLGVEGMDGELIYDLLKPYEDEGAFLRIEENPISKTDMYIDGLTSHENSAQKRDELAKKLGLPVGMTPNAMLAALKMICTYEEYLELVGRNKQ